MVKIQLKQQNQNTTTTKSKEQKTLKATYVQTYGYDRWYFGGGGEVLGSNMDRKNSSSCPAWEPKHLEKSSMKFSGLISFSVGTWKNNCWKTWNGLKIVVFLLWFYLTLKIENFVYIYILHYAIDRLQSSFTIIIWRIIIIIIFTIVDKYPHLGFVKRHTCIEVH